MTADPAGDTGGRPLRIALVAPSRFPIRQPYPGGLEAMVGTLAPALRALGHEVELYAVEGTEGASRRFAFPGVRWSEGSSPTDTGYPAGGREAEHRAFDALVDHLVVEGGHDVIHNHSLHPGLLVRAGELPAPLLTTLHTPPFPELGVPLARAAAAGRSAGRFAAVSRWVADAWDPPSPAAVVPNGVDLDAWPAGPGGDALVWTGRLVPEKAPHLALETAREAGLPIRLAGRVGDADYVRDRVRPLLSADREYVGELDHAGVAELVGGSACALVTPRWDEPFALVAAEALACGTPVAAVARGGVPEALGRWAGLCTTPHADPVPLAAAVRRALTLDRSALRADAHARLGADAMARAYLDLYIRLMDPVPAP